jgi:Transposase DDE domain
LSLEFADEYPEPLFRQFIYSVWSYPLSAISALYRLRWRIEIAFRHLKSGAGLVGRHSGDARSAKAHILCNLLLALLTEPLIADHLGDSPRREAA